MNSLGRRCAKLQVFIKGWTNIVLQRFLFNCELFPDLSNKNPCSYYYLTLYFQIVGYRKSSCPEFKKILQPASFAVCNNTTFKYN